MSYPRIVFVLLLLLSGVFLNALSYLKGKEWITFLSLGSSHNFSHLDYGNFVVNLRVFTYCTVFKESITFIN